MSGSKYLIIATNQPSSWTDNVSPSIYYANGSRRGDVEREADQQRKASNTEREAENEDPLSVPFAVRNTGP